MASIQFTPFPVLVTERLVLRKSVDSDAPETFFMRTDARVNTYIERSRPETVEDAMAFNHKVNANTDNNEGIVWALTLKGEDKLIDSVCLWQIVPEENKGEIGFELHPDQQGKGIMSEALERVLHYAFNTVELQRLDGWAHRDNAASIKLMERHGFVRDTVQEEKMKGELGVMRIYVLRQSETVKIS